jgi:hypothetical protein
MIDFPIRHASHHDIATLLRLVYHSILIFRPVQTWHLHVRSILPQYQRSGMVLVTLRPFTLCAVKDTLACAITAKGEFK